jgi:putative hydrolase of the HAD superfamily
MQHMSVPQAVIFDLGGTLLDWPDWNEDVSLRWALSYDYLTTTMPGYNWPDRDAYVRAMLEAEQAHWQRVVTEQWSGPPSSLLSDGFRRLGLPVHEAELMAALDGYARAVDGWAVVFPDTRPTLQLLRERSYRIGVLSNTWWAAQWHNADLAAHGLTDLLDEVAYTSDLPHSKPHPSVFLEVGRRLDVEPTACVMVGDRMIDDISGALGAGMRAVWKRTDYPWPKPEHIIPTATITQLLELPELLRSLGGR